MVVPDSNEALMIGPWNMSSLTMEHAKPTSSL